MQSLRKIDKGGYARSLSINRWNNTTENTENSQPCMALSAVKVQYYGDGVGRSLKKMALSDGLSAACFEFAFLCSDQMDEPGLLPFSALRQKSVMNDKRPDACSSVGLEIIT